MNIFDVASFVKEIGLLGIWLVIFVESGIFLGFFFPGDSLLFTAGFLASQDFLPIVPLVIGSFIAAVLGDSVGYAFGRKMGEKIFNRDDSRFFNKKHLETTKNFFERYGKKSVILARFVPIVRTYTPIFAGVGKMNYRDFLLYNIIGGLLWAVGITLLGYYLGNLIPGIDEYLLPVILLIIIISVLPAVIEFWKAKRGAARD